MSLRDSAVVALARAWIRYAPTVLLKEPIWRFVHWRDHEYVARTGQGFRMRGHSNDLVQGYAYYFGIWEPNLTAWLSRRFAEMRGAVFLDVGANVGYYSLLAHRLMSDDAAVVSIEASPMIYGMLARNIQLNRYRRIRAVNCAAAAQAGTLMLYQGGDENLGGTTTQEGVWTGNAIPVPAMRLADVLTAEEIARLRLVKIDVEGAELSVLEGLAPIIPQLRRDVEFVVEIGTGNAAPIFALFESAGFNAYGISNLYSYKTYLKAPPIDAPRRLWTRPLQHGDVVFSRLDQGTL